ncbi:MAG: ferrochelatase [Myxococcota bacterium]
MQGRTGVLLVNLGTPDSPAVPDVARYLREFLTDGRVIDLSPAARWALVNLVIVPFRSAKSAHAYRSIWTAEGSPLMVHSRALEAALRARAPMPVALAMRYGRPSIAEGLAALGDVARIVVVPLYPQYASSTTGTALEAVYRALAARTDVPAVSVVPPFFDDPGWLDAQAALVPRDVDHVLMSFHGLPERHVTGTPGCELSDTCCARVPPFCYRAHCVATARALGERVGLPWSLSFQSRLGRERWLGPATEDEIARLAKAGVKRLAVACPSFVSDCLETLEEIGMRGGEVFREHGGERFVVAPCVNADPAWVEALARMVQTCS